MRTAIPPGLPRLRRHQPDDHHRHPADAGRPAQRGRQDPAGPLHPGARATRAAQSPLVPRSRSARPAGRLSAGGERQERGGAPPVTTGAAVESRRVIATGLTVGEWVVVNGVLRPRPPAGHPRSRGRARAGGPSLASGEEGGAVISKFFIEHPIFANVIALVTVIVGGCFLYGLPSLSIRDRAADLQVSTRYPARARGGRGHDRVPLEASDQRRRELNLHVVDQAPATALHPDHHLRRRDGPRHSLALVQNSPTAPCPSSREASPPRGSRSARSPQHPAGGEPLFRERSL